MALDCSRAHTVVEDFSAAGVLRLALQDDVEDPSGLTSGAVRPAAPLRLRVDEGRRSADWLGTTWGTVAVVSPRFQQVLRDVGATGWTTWPAQVEGCPELAGWAGLAVTGRTGPLRDELSERLLAPPPVPGGEPWPALRGLLVDPASWDGSDVFLPSGTALVCVVERVRDALVAAGVRGCVFERMSEALRPVLDER